ncbi:hypothetical protein [Nocardia iowensis]|uniref:Uncharacterized protein n=1 Tax=Nocardia iowensis TaxID=204891 RepID=A0ABX8S0V3_NOCIO|nr:hypothetical protein [Nocardia iowensis]QXN94699.1 hypothetical protein KV110_17570 [Nocardia iowensis]
MSSFDDAIAAARRDADHRDHTQQSQQRHDAEFAEQINQVLAEAAEQFRQLNDGLRLQLVRPKKFLERTSADIVDTAGTRYVVADEQRCWIVPPYGNRSHGADVLFTEHGGLLYVSASMPPISGGPPRIPRPDPFTIIVTEPPHTVDVRKEFEHGHRYDEDPHVCVIRTLRSALAQCFVEYERAIQQSVPLGDLFRKWPIQWRR